MIRKQRSCFKEGTVNYASPFNPEYALWKGSTALDLFCHILEKMSFKMTVIQCRYGEIRNNFCEKLLLDTTKHYLISKLGNRMQQYCL